MVPLSQFLFATILIIDGTIDYESEEPLSWIDIIFLLFNLHHGPSAKIERKCLMQRLMKVIPQNPIEMLRQVAKCGKTIGKP